MSIDHISMAPILRWAGSKRKIAKQLVKLAPEFTGQYIEPFVGSGCLYFGLNSKNSVISDANINLINFYKHLINNHKKILETAKSINRDAECYYKARMEFNEISSSVRKSSLFFYLNRNCYNGIYRTNINGHFNVPFGGDRIGGYPSNDLLKSASKKLKNTKLYCEDFEVIVKHHAKKGDFVYLDPPYYMTDRRSFVEYSAKPFCADDFERLSMLLHWMDEREIYYLLSYPLCELSENIARGRKKMLVEINRSIASKISARGKAEEILIRNY